MWNRPLLIAPLLALGAAAMPSTPSATHPAAQPATRPTVFRCVLDGNARMIVISLGRDVYAAYDANRCTLAKVWQGEVILTGPVYDTRHGPQPKSAGKQLLDRAGNLAPKPAPAATQPTDYANVNGYLGYGLKDDRATLHFDFDGVTVDDAPVLVPGDAGTIILRRTIAVGGAVSTTRPYAFDVPTSSSVRKVRVVSGAAVHDGKPLAVPADVPFDAAVNVPLSVTAPGTLTIETTFVTE